MTKKSPRKDRQATILVLELGFLFSHGSIGHDGITVTAAAAADSGVLILLTLHCISWLCKICERQVWRKGIKSAATGLMGGGRNKVRR